MYLVLDKKSVYYPLWCVQIPIVLLCCAVFFLQHSEGVVFRSALFGGFVSIVSQTLFASSALHKTGAHYRQSIVLRFYGAMLIKWCSVFVLSLSFFYFFILLAFPFFLTYIIGTIAAVIALRRQGFSSKQVSMHG